MAKSAFEDILLPDDFEPMAVFMEGKKDKDGSALVSSTDILDGKVNNPGGKNDEEDDNEELLELENQGKLDKMLSKVTGDDDDNDDLEDENGGRSDDDDDLDKNQASNKSKSDSDANPYQALYNLMVEGVLWEEEEDFDGSEEKFLEIKEKNIERMRSEDLEAYIDQAFEKNPDGKNLGKTLLAHLAAGGKLRDFIETNEGADVTEADLDNDDTVVATEAAESLTRAYLTMIGWEPDEIKTFIKNKKDKDLLIDYAKEHMGPYQKQVAKKNEDRINAQKDADLQRKKDVVRYTTQVNEIITSSEKVGTVELPKTPKEKKALLNYMLVPVELEDGRTMPKFTADYIKLSKDPEFNVFLATALQNWKAKDGKKPNNTISTKDTVRGLLSRTKKDDDNNGQRRQQAQPRPKTNTVKNWSF